MYMPRFATFYYGSVRFYYGLLGSVKDYHVVDKSHCQLVAPFGGVLGFTRFLVGFHYVLLGFITYIAVIKT
jgi:hypothetical protein